MLSYIVFAAGIVAAEIATHSPIRHMENLVTFGDSYTDESRASYFASHGHAPPPGVLLPPSNQTSGGGEAWGRFASEFSGAKYYNYAVAGAMCSNNITSHWFDPIKAPFPSVLEYEVEAFEEDIKYRKLYPNRRSDNTVYALWIGTNDLGIDGFLSDRNAAGTSITSFLDCLWQTFDHVYKTGGRHFFLLNEAPLHVSPMYAAPENGGTLDNNYWRNKTMYNMTEYQYKMFEYSTSVNTMIDYGVPFQLLVKKRWPGATFGVFDVHSLMLDIHADPSKYLDAPAHVIGSYRTCDNSGCADSKDPLSSFMWYVSKPHSMTIIESFLANALSRLLTC